MEKSRKNKTITVFYMNRNCSKKTDWSEHCGETRLRNVER